MYHDFRQCGKIYIDLKSCLVNLTSFAVIIMGWLTNWQFCSSDFN